METELLKFELNGCTFLYTGEINNRNYLDELCKNEKYIHVKCKISSNKSESHITHDIVRCISDNKCLNTTSGIEEFVNEIVQSMEISYDKNKFIKNLIKFIKEEYLSKLLNFNRLEDIFKLSLYKDKLSCVFDRSVFIPRKTHIDFDTKIEIYPYAFNNKPYLHIKVSYGNNLPDSCISKSVFEYELTNHNGVHNYYKDTCGILSEIFDRGYVIPTINYSVDIIVNMIKYCFDENLFKNIEQIG